VGKTGTLGLVDSVGNLRSESSAVNYGKSLVTSGQFLGELSGKFFVVLGGGIIRSVFIIHILLPSDQIRLSGGEESFVIIDGVDGLIESLIVILDLSFEIGNFGVLGSNFVVVISNVLLFVSGELGKRFFEVLLNTEEEVGNLLEGISVGEFFTLHGQEGLDEGGFGSVTEGLLDLGHMLVELTDLSQTNFTIVVKSQ